MIPKIILENAFIDMLAADPRARAEFGACLDPVIKAPRKEGCNRCGNRPAVSYYEQSKDCLGQMDQSKKDRLKALLNTKQVEIPVGSGKGVRRYIF